MPAPVSRSGPRQCRQRAGRRQRSQATAGTYPARGTWTSTGASAASASRAASKAAGGMRACAAAEVGARNVVVAGGLDPRARRRRTCARCADDRLSPAAVQQQLGLRGPGEPADQHRAGARHRPQHQHLAGVRVRGAGLGQQIVPVVEHRDQAQVRDRRERGRPGARDHHPVAPADARNRRYRSAGPRSAASVTCRSGPSAAVSAASSRARSRGVGDDQQGAPTGARAPPPRSRRAGPASPPRAGPARPRGRAALPDRLEEGRSGRVVAGPLRRHRRGGDLGRGHATAPRRAWRQVPAPARARRQVPAPRTARFSTRACRGGTASRSTSATVPAYRSATDRARSATSAVSTGSGETTRSMKPSAPVCSDSATRASTNPPTSRPANRTRPGPPAARRASSPRSTR